VRKENFKTRDEAEGNPEPLVIFEPAMHDLPGAGSIVTDSILEGTIGE
jgi:hypothetical protein